MKKTKNVEKPFRAHVPIRDRFEAAKGCKYGKPYFNWQNFASVNVRHPRGVKKEKSTNLWEFVYGG